MTEQDIERLEDRVRHLEFSIGDSLDSAEFEEYIERSTIAHGISDERMEFSDKQRILRVDYQGMDLDILSDFIQRVNEDPNLKYNQNKYEDKIAVIGGQ